MKTTEKTVNGTETDGGICAEAVPAYWEVKARACHALLFEKDAEIERLEAALETSEAWIDRWTAHVGTCRGGGDCTCRRTAVLFEARAALPKP